MNESHELILSDPSSGATQKLGVIDPAIWRVIEFHMQLGGDKPKIDAWLDGKFVGSIPLQASDRTIASIYEHTTPESLRSRGIDVHIGPTRFVDRA